MYSYYGNVMKKSVVTRMSLRSDKDVAGLDINVCPIPVKTDVGRVDLVSRLSDGTSEKITVLPFEVYFL